MATHNFVAWSSYSSLSFKFFFSLSQFLTPFLYKRSSNKTFDISKPLYILFEAIQCWDKTEQKWKYRYWISDMTATIFIFGSSIFFINIRCFLFSTNIRIWFPWHFLAVIVIVLNWIMLFRRFKRLLWVWM